MIQLVNSEGFSLGLYQDEAAILKEKNKGAVEVPVCEQNFIIKKWSFLNEVWIEGATLEEIDEYNLSLVPQELHRMKIFLELAERGISRTNLKTIVNSAPSEMLTEIEKAKINVKIDTAQTFRIDDPNLVLLAPIVGITDLPEFFISANQQQ